MKLAAILQSPIAKRLTTIAIAVIFSIFIFQFSISEARAQCTYDPNATDQQLIDQFNRCAIEADVYDDKIFNFNQIAGTVDSLNTQILGFSFLHPETNQVTAGRGALAATSNLVATLYGNPPASGVQYFASQIQKFNPVAPAYAQTTGIGYQALTSAQELWKVFRNASYVGFVIVFVIVGFMIMFRAHISPQAVATVQDSLPRIIIALALVTFSYAIAGLMIDLMFLILNILINLLARSGVIEATVANSVIFDKSIIGVIIKGWPEVFTRTAEAIKDLLDSVISGGGIIGLLKWGVGGIAGLIVGIAALFIMFRLFIMLLTAYVMVILLTLIAPFFFLIQALPGNTGAKEWFKQMASNIAVFPAVAIMILIAGIIGGITAFGGTGAGGLASDVPLKFPLLVGGLRTDAIGKIIALGFLFITPQVAQMIKEMIGAKGPAFGPAAAAALGAGANVLGKPIGAAVSPYAQMIGERAKIAALKPFGYRSVTFPGKTPEK